MKTLGIIGGVGPQTTAKVYLSVIDLIRGAGKTKYPPIVIYNLPFPFIIENEAIVQGVNSEKMIPYLINGAKVLEKAGADFGILPCNTLHMYMNDITNSTNIPFLSILDETADFLVKRNVKTVGILATETTIQSKIYENVLKKNNINIVYPATKEQEKVNRVIVELLDNKKNKQQKIDIELVCCSLKDGGAEIILFACTDLQLIMNEIKTSIDIVDTTDILIKASVKKILED